MAVFGDHVLHSHTCGEGGSSEGWATWELQNAKRKQSEIKIHAEIMNTPNCQCSKSKGMIKAVKSCLPLITFCTSKDCAIPKRR